MKELRQTLEKDVSELRAGETRSYVLNEHHLRVAVTRALGIHTGRRRYRVECLSCSEIVHPGTTGAVWYMQFHLRHALKKYTPENLTAEDFELVEREALEAGDKTLARLANRAAIGDLLPYAKQRVSDILNARKRPI